ncbi:MAG: trigger factor, partial [Xanthomonadales bacterium]|nr:trigger factor [Xanthomonadales bacterium]
TALIEVYPEFEKVDVSHLEITRPQAEVTEQDVDEMLETLRKQRMDWEEVERKARDDDRVQIEYAAETGEGRVPEEGVQRLNLFMGGTDFEKLEKAVAAIAPGEEKTVKLLFPDDYQEPRLAGKKAKVDLKVVSVSEGTLPEVDEEFIKSFGIEDGRLESLRQEIRANLERELKQATTAVLKKQVIGALVDSAPEFEAPASIVRNEATSLAAQMASSRGLEPDPALVEPFMSQARQRVRAGLLMGAVAEQNGIRIDAAKVRATIETIASTYEQPTEVIQMYYGNERLLEQVESSVMEEQVVDWVLENAKVTSRETGFQDVISQAGQ